MIGFTQKDYTVTEGQTVNICVEMTAGNASQPIEVLVRVDRSFSASKLIFCVVFNVKFIRVSKCPMGSSLYAVWKEVLKKPGKPLMYFANFKGC